MNTEHQHSDTRANDLPNAESTQIEKSAKTPLKRLRLTLANRFGFHGSSNSPTVQTPPPKRNASTPTTKSLNKLDPQVYWDTQSNGFASRVVKYHEASEAKTRDISNKAYRRLGDFPIVNLDKSEINLNQKHANAPKVSKINIAPPINLVSASARSAIFRTGKNYGDSYPMGPIGKIGPIEGRKPIRTSISQDEPIVPSTSDYDGGSARSSLEALKEISRKRIHCDEIDGEVNKKQRGETTQDECDSNSAQTPAGSKRTRDRTSPSYCSSSNEVQMKRYRNNDILSSLSSSILMRSTPKRSSLNSDAIPAKVIHLDRDQGQDQDQTKHTHERPTADSTSSIKPRSTESSRVGTSNSDLPLHRPMEQIKPVIKSVSDGHVPKPETSKTPKLTLFNRDYSKIPKSNERTRSIDDDDDYSVSFVKPKAKASTLFSGSKNRDQQSKLQMMLSFLRGDESKDEVDSVPSSKVADDKKSNEKDDPKVTVSSPPPANLSTTTSVTFSTATTTSVLNAPANAINTSPTEVKPPIKEIKENLKEPEKVPAPSSIGLVPITSAPAAATILPVSSAAQSEDKTSAPAKTVTFNFSPSAQATTAPISLLQTTSTTSDSVPRLGGFCFSSTSPSFTLPTVAKPTAIATTAENSSIPQSSTESPKSTPVISFGLPQSTGTTNSTLPSLGTPVFGSANALAKPATTNTQPLQSNQTTSAPPTFNFGSPASKPTLASSTSVAFGSLSSNTAASTAMSSVGTSAPSMFSFGATTNTANPAPTAAFGSNVPTTSAPSFSFNSSAAGAPATTTSLPTSNQSKPSFSFGNTANANKPETSAFQFGNPTSNKAPLLSFGAASTASTTAGATPLFGSINTAKTNTNTNTNTTATTQSTFTFTPNKPTVDTKPLQFGTPTAKTTQSTGLGAFSSPTPTFGQVNSAAPPPYGQTPTFGNITNTPTTAAGTPSLFGNVSSPQNTSIFGQQSNNSTPSALPKIENSFGMPSNQNSSAPVFGSNQSQTSTFGSPMNAPPAFGSTSNNVFGNTPATQNQPTFGSGNSLFSTPAPTTTQSQNNAFGSAGMFTFGQNATQSPANTAPQGIFGSPSTNSTNTTANTAFVFGQSNNNAATPNQSPGIFGAKPADNLNASSALSAPPSFGGSSPAFNFSAAKPNAGFSFGASNTPAANVPAFGSSSTPPQFGSTNGMGTSFSFNTPNNTADASKSFAFGGPATAPAATPASFSFNAPTPTPTPTPPPNAFQFNAQQPAANIFSIGPGSGTNTTKTGRPMRTATRRIK